MLIEKKQKRHKIKRIQTKSQQLGADEGDKIYLLFFDDKQYILNDQTAMAYGHKDTSLA